MSNILHVLNGDSTAHVFKDSGLKGDTMIWREMLCEGPLYSTISDDRFWLKRYTYFEENLGVSRLDYYDKSVKELIKLEDISSYDEVVLWFEYDLFCQVNLLAACSMLMKSFRKDVNYFLVCVGKETGTEKMVSLANFSGLEYRELYESKIKLSKTNLEFATACWELFVEGSVEELKAFDFNKSSKFQYLASAIDQQLKRFPDANGLNEIHRKLLNLINENSFTEKELVRKMLLWQEDKTVYGFGDLQYFNYLKELNAYIDTIDGVYKLNKSGEKVMHA